VQCFQRQLIALRTFTLCLPTAFLNDHYVAVRIAFGAQPELAHKLGFAQSRAKLPSGFPLTMLITPDGKEAWSGTIKLWTYGLRSSNLKHNIARDTA
jgi:uncharacterized protein YyaL (SSP411 family)